MAVSRGSAGAGPRRPAPRRDPPRLVTLTSFNSVEAGGGSAANWRYPYPRAMANDVKVLAPRLETSSDTSDPRRSSSRLPDEMAAEQVERLALFGAITGGLWTLGLFLDVVMTPLTWNTRISVPAVTLELCGMAVAAWMYWYARC